MAFHSLWLKQPSVDASSRAVFATQKGTVAEARVRRGDQVKQGDVLVVLSDPRLAPIRSPIAGTVLTADVERRLLNRHVAAGEVLLELQPDRAKGN